MRVWIEEGCLPCNACEAVVPEVFAIPEAEALILGTARADGVTGDNRVARSPLIIAVDRQLIEEAAEGCPVQVIRWLME